MDARIYKLGIREAARAVADLVMPRVCIVCARPLLLREEHICTTCLADLPLTRFSALRNNPMALYFNDLVQKEIDAEGVGHEPFCYAAALIFYSGESPYRHIPKGLKYGRNFGEGRFFARMLGRELAASPLFADVDAILPVPLHRGRLRERGYNQAEVIARALAEELPSAAVYTSVIKRVRRTRTQTALSPQGRYANVKSAFVAEIAGFGKGPRPCRKIFRALSKGGSDRHGETDKAGFPKHILLVDDVFTTGATLCACERAIRKVIPPSCRISAATLAFVGR